VWTDALSDFHKGWAADEAGNFEEAMKWYRLAAEQGCTVISNKQFDTT
jgi:TPR repeat protein